MGKIKSRWFDISDILTERAVRELQTGHVLMFQKNGQPNHIKIKRKAKNGKIWAVHTRLYREEEVDIVDKKKK